VHIELTLSLPSEACSVPLARHLVGAALDSVGADASCAHEIAVVLSEACTNVLQHAEQSDTYEIAVSLDQVECSVRVTELGPGTAEVPDLADASAEGEHGRGLLLMRALVDDLRFEQAPKEGTAVHFAKRLESTARDGLLASGKQQAQRS